MSANLIKSGFMILALSITPFLTFDTWASSSDIVSSTIPNLTSLPQPPRPLQVDDTVLISPIIINPTGKDVSIAIIVEVRNSDGSSDSVEWQNMMIAVEDKEYQVGFDWSPDHSGIFQLRTFVISNFGSDVMTISETKTLNATVKSVERSCVGTARCISGIVTRIIDGDTLDVDETRIRLAIVNTPESGQPGYEEAANFSANLCPVGSQVLVDEDDNQTQESFGRIVAKVYCGERNLNHQLLKAGMASGLSEFCSVSEFAHEPWAMIYGCGVFKEPSLVTDEDADMNCDPSYPDVCISPPPPDLDCGDISYRDFRVLQPDPHRFDSNEDGMGCES